MLPALPRRPPGPLLRSLPLLRLDEKMGQWNRALARPAGDWLRVALDANVDLACNTSVTIVVVVVDVTVCSGTHSSVHQTPYRDSDHLIVHTVFPTGPYRPGIT